MSTQRPTYKIGPAAIPPPPIALYSKLWESILNSPRGSPRTYHSPTQTAHNAMPYALTSNDQRLSFSLTWDRCVLTSSISVESLAKSVS